MLHSVHQLDANFVCLLFDNDQLMTFLNQTLFPAAGNKAGENGEMPELGDNCVAP